jgi:hypothetical protein
VIEEPKDFLGFLLHTLINKQLENPDVSSDVKTWNMTVVLDTNYYPITIAFDNGVSISKHAIENPTLKVALSLDTVIRLAMNETSIVKAVMKREIKITGLLRHPKAVMKFYGLLSSILKG